jgi:hypothetical protein
VAIKSGKRIEAEAEEELQINCCDDQTFDRSTRYGRVNYFNEINTDSRSGRVKRRTREETMKSRQFALFSSVKVT